MKIGVFYHHLQDAAVQQGWETEEALSRARSLGIEGVDINFDAGEDPCALKKRLDAAGLEAVSLYSRFRFGESPEEEHAHRFADAASYLGAQRLLCIPGFLESDSDRIAQLERMRENLRALCVYARERGITVTLEDFDRDSAPYADTRGLLYFLDAIPELGLTFDTGNFRFAGEDVCAAYDALRGRIVHVHLKDRAADGVWGGPATISRTGELLYPCAAGSGMLPLGAVIRRLRQDGYTGFVTIEHFRVRDVWTAVCRSAEWLEDRIRTESECEGTI